MKKNNTSLCKIEYLKPGEKFEIPGLSDTMRNMKMIRSSDCSSLIEGQRRDSKSDDWKPFRYPIANSVMVKVVNEFSMESNNNTNKQQQKNMQENKVKRGRGRPKKDKISLAEMKGIDGEFTVNDLVKVNQIKPHQAHIAIKSAIMNGQVKQSSERKSGRGKPQKVYKLI